MCVSEGEKTRRREGVGEREREMLAVEEVKQREV